MDARAENMDVFGKNMDARAENMDVFGKNMDARAKNRDVFVLCAPINIPTHGHRPRPIGQGGPGRVEDPFTLRVGQGPPAQGALGAGAKRRR
jgi:hypothetical protein